MPRRRRIRSAGRPWSCIFWPAPHPWARPALFRIKVPGFSTPAAAPAGLPFQKAPPPAPRPPCSRCRARRDSPDCWRRSRRRFLRSWCNRKKPCPDRAHSPAPAHSRSPPDTGRRGAPRRQPFHIGQEPGGSPAEYLGRKRACCRGSRRRPRRPILWPAGKSPRPSEDPFPHLCRFHSTRPKPACRRHSPARQIFHTAPRRGRDPFPRPRPPHSAAPKRTARGQSPAPRPERTAPLPCPCPWERRSRSGTARPDCTGLRDCPVGRIPHKAPPPFGCPAPRPVRPRSTAPAGRGSGHVPFPRPAGSSRRRARRFFQSHGRRCSTAPGGKARRDSSAGRLGGSTWRLSPPIPPRPGRRHSSALKRTSPVPALPCRPAKTARQPARRPAPRPCPDDTARPARTARRRCGCGRPPHKAGRPFLCPVPRRCQTRSTAPESIAPEADAARQPA